MSENCINCVKNERTGSDLLCDDCRKSKSAPATGSVTVPTIMAFLQNMWVKNPDRVKAMVQREGEEFRRRFMEYALFRGCITGRRIKAAFKELCDGIIWEETTREIAGDPKIIFPADISHMIDSIRTHKPAIIVTFGTIAWNAICDVQEQSICCERCKFIRAMHPAARHPDIMGNLNGAADQLRDLLKVSQHPS